MQSLFYSLPPAGSHIPKAAILKALRNRRCDLGQLQEGMKIFLGTKHSLFVSSGKAAIWLALRALSQRQADRNEIVIPAYTCPDVASAILKLGFAPVLCDINLADFGFDMCELNRKVSNKTLAVLVVHLFGYPANVEEVKEFCRAKGLFLVEDAAQALGNSLVDGPEKKLGTFGDVGAFSFGRGKPISLGHGGIFGTNSGEIFAEAKKIVESIDQGNGAGFFRYILRVGSYSVFANPYLYWIPRGIPLFHLGETIFEPDFTVSLGLGPAASLFAQLLPAVEGERKVRKDNSSWYFQEFHDIPWVEDAPRGDLPYLRYPLLIKGRERRDLVLDRLMSEGTGASIFYPTPLNELPGLRELLNDSEIYPNAKRLSESLITLPVHFGVKESHRKNILNIVLKADRGAKDF